MHEKIYKKIFLITRGWRFSNISLLNGWKIMKVKKLKLLIKVPSINSKNLILKMSKSANKFFSYTVKNYSTRFKGFRIIIFLHLSKMKKSHFAVMLKLLLLKLINNIGKILSFIYSSSPRTYELRVNCRHSIYMAVWSLLFFFLIKSIRRHNWKIINYIKKNNVPCSRFLYLIPIIFLLFLFFFLTSCLSWIMAKDLD